MLITRHHHLRYMTKLTPVLIIAYILQVLLYREFAPAELTQEITVFLGVGLTILISGYCFYDHYHQVNLKPNYIEINFSPLKIKHEILYTKITKVDIRSTRFGYGNLKLYQQNGEIIKISHVDNAEMVANFIKTSGIQQT